LYVGHSNLDADTGATQVLRNNGRGADNGAGANLRVTTLPEGVERVSAVRGIVLP
jgi:hypothetical protein